MAPASVRAPSRSAGRIGFHARVVALVGLLVLVGGGAADAQVRERPVPFDSGGRITAITPPIAARLGLQAPLWPVTGSYVDARLYALDDSASGYVLVVRRPGEVVDRYPLDAARRAEIGAAVGRGAAVARTTIDSAPPVGSEIVRGGFVINQTALGALLFGPLAASAIDEPAASAAAYLLVAGASFFISAQRAKSSAVSRSQNHLAWHGARQGAAAGALAMITVRGDDEDGENAVAWAMLAGGIAGDVLGYRFATTLTDAEAHGVSHGATSMAALAAGVSGILDLYDNSGNGRGAAGAILGAGLVGYPLGLRYVRGAPHRVTAGDVGTLGTAELIGLAGAAAFISDDPSATAVASLLTGGYLVGLVAGDRVWVRPYDFTVPEARLLQFGAIAGGLMGAAIPVLASVDDPRPVFAASAIGGVIGALVSMRNIEPRRAAGRNTVPEAPRTGSRTAPRFDVELSPQVALLARLGQRGHYPLMSVRF